jgi:(p)ppGpp synthase/HD superfamily hydrolase
MEVATIVATLTDDRTVIAAAVLHDVIEDASVTYDELVNNFSVETADLIADESENKREGTPVIFKMDRKNLRNSNSQSLKMAKRFGL